MNSQKSLPKSKLTFWFKVDSKSNLLVDPCQLCFVVEGWINVFSVNIYINKYILQFVFSFPNRKLNMEKNLDAVMDEV